MGSIKYPPILTSFLDDDLYKLAIQRFVHNRLGVYEPVAEHAFFDRKPILVPDGFEFALRGQVESMADLVLKPNEADFLVKDCSHALRPEDVDWLRSYRFNPSQVSIAVKNNRLQLTTFGPWEQTVLWEVRLMAIITELLNLMTGRKLPDDWTDQSKFKAKELVRLGAKTIEFGTRRRSSRFAQYVAIREMKKHMGEFFVGTSNLYFAQLFGIPAKGTVAHEVIQGLAAIYGYERANWEYLYLWNAEFGKGMCTAALTDTFTTPVFLRVFGDFVDKYGGSREDSGNPLVHEDRFISFYQERGIKPSSKLVLHSNSLDLAAVGNIQEYRPDMLDKYYGIGTFVTNPYPINIVIKLIALYLKGLRHNTVKIPDDPGKAIGDPGEISFAKNVLKI